MCTCASHCPDSPYHERACCPATSCECECHRVPPRAPTYTRDDARAECERVIANARAR